MAYAGILLITPNNKLILQQKDNIPGIVYPGMITTFGGKVEEDESPKQAALREINEELSLVLDDIELLKVFHKPINDHDDNVNCYIFIARNINIENLKIREGKRWVLMDKKNEGKKLNLSPLAKEIVEFFNKKLSH